MPWLTTLIPKFSEPYDSKFVVCMLYKNILSLINFIYRIFCIFHCMWCTLTSRALINRYEWMIKIQQNRITAKQKCCNIPSLRSKMLISSFLLWPRPLGRGIKRWRASDIWRLSVCLSDVWRLSDDCLSRTSGLSREQRGLGRLKLAEVAHVTRDSDTTFKVKRSKVKVTRPLY